MKIALAQMGAGKEPAENLKRAEQYAADASQQGTKLLIFPEMFMALPPKNSPLSAIAEPLDGPFVTILAKIAQKHTLHIVAGIWEKIPGEERVYNTVLLLSADGAILTFYRKLHLFDALQVQESRTIKLGEALPLVASVNEFTCGMAICYDLRFPELFRHLALQGANVLLIPSAWYAGSVKEEHWLTLLRARAIENTCYVVGVNQTGSAFCGRSVVFDPFGVPVVDAGEEERLLLAELHAKRVADVREKLPALQHIRSDL